MFKSLCILISWTTKIDLENLLISIADLRVFRKVVIKVGALIVEQHSLLYRAANLFLYKLFFSISPRKALKTWKKCSVVVIGTVHPQLHDNVSDVTWWRKWWLYHTNTFLVFLFAAGTKTRWWTNYVWVCSRRLKIDSIKWRNHYLLLGKPLWYN